MTKIDIRAARLALGLTQEQFAERVGMTRAHIGKIEAGMVKPTRTLEILAALLVERHITRPAG